MVGEYATYMAAIGNSDFEPPRRQGKKSGALLLSKNSSRRLGVLAVHIFPFTA
jgi:hypothetical protein